MPTAAPISPPSPRQEPASVSFKTEEIRKALRQKFLFEGTVAIKHLYTADGIGRFRVNWFLRNDDGPFISQSRFIMVKRNDDDTIEIEDATVVETEKKELFLMAK